MQNEKEALCNLCNRGNTLPIKFCPLWIAVNILFALIITSSHNNVWWSFELIIKWYCNIFPNHTNNLYFSITFFNMFYNWITSFIFQYIFRYSIHSRPWQVRPKSTVSPYFCHFRFNFYFTLNIAIIHVNWLYKCVLKSRV